MGNVISNDADDRRYKKHSGFSSTVTSSFAMNTVTPDNRSFVYSLENDVIGGDEFNDKVFISTGFTSTISDSLAVTGPNVFYGISHMPTGGTSWDLVRCDGDTVFKHTGFTATIADSFGAGTPAFPNIRGGTFSPDWNWVHQDANNKNVKYTGFTSTVLDSFTHSASSPTGVGFDDNYDMYTCQIAFPDAHFKHIGYTATISNSYTFWLNSNNCYDMDWDGRQWSVEIPAYGYHRMRMTQLNIARF